MSNTSSLSETNTLVVFNSSMPKSPLRPNNIPHPLPLHSSSTLSVPPSNPDHTLISLLLQIPHSILLNHGDTVSYLLQAPTLILPGAMSRLITQADIPSRLMLLISKLRQDKGINNDPVIPIISNQDCVRLGQHRNFGRNHLLNCFGLISTANIITILRLYRYSYFASYPTIIPTYLCTFTDKYR